MDKKEILEIIEDERVKTYSGIKFVYYLDDNTQIKVYNKNGEVIYNLSVYADKNIYGKFYNNNLKINNDYELERCLLLKENEDEEFLNYSLYDKEFNKLDTFLAYQLNNKTINELIKKIDKNDLLEEVQEIKIK